jgi:hypothetical protein
MLVTMRRTQLYLDEDLWNVLHFQARKNGQTVSELVRKAARDKYMGNPDERRAAMEAIVGLWHDRKDIENAEVYIRKMRSGAKQKRRRQK